MRHVFVACERAHFPLAILCRLLAVSCSGFHEYLRRQAQPGPDKGATPRCDLRRGHAESRGLHGRSRLVTDLRELSHPVGPKRVTRPIREEGLRGRTKGRARPRAMDSGHARPVAENLLDRQLDGTSNDARLGQRHHLHRHPRAPAVPGGRAEPRPDRCWDAASPTAYWMT